MRSTSAAPISVLTGDSMLIGSFPRVTQRTESNIPELRPIPSEGEPRKLELGCGERPTPGYLHNDKNAFPGVDLVGNPWELDLESSSLDEVLALGVVEHLTYSEARDTFRNVHRILVPGGVFVFDVPDLPVWCGYVVDYFAGKPTPFPIQHLLATLYGWQRWTGDEHHSGWYKELVEEELVRVGFARMDYGVDQFLERGHVRNRMFRPADAHIYCIAHK